MKRVCILFIMIVSISALFAQKIDKISASIEQSPSGNETLISVSYIIPEGMHQTLNKDFFLFSIESSIELILGEIKYPEGKIENELEVFYGEVVLTANIGIPGNILPGTYPVQITAEYQLCDETGTLLIFDEIQTGTCFFPQSTIISAILTISDVINIQTEYLWYQIVQFLFMALLGGLLLNIMPCVLPVLSIKALSLVNQSNHDRKKILTGSLLYTAGILVSLLILAIIVIILKLSGELVGWGFHFQNPGFVIVLLTVITVFTLSLFDVFIFNAPGMNAAAKASGTKGHMGSFLSGIFAVLLATPCTAPFLGTALAFAFSQPPAMIISIFLMVGIGLATPFILLGIKPGIIKKIPKPGAWMNTFKALMGFLLIGTGIWLIDVLYYQIGWNGSLKVLIFLVVTGFSAALYGHYTKPTASKRKQWAALAAAVIITVAGAVLLFSGEQKGFGPEVAADEHENWEIFSPEKLEYYRISGKRVFIDFSAKWCMTCKVNEETVLFTEKIETLFAENDIALLRGDFTNNDKTIAEWIQKFGRAGVPVYAYYDKFAEEPIILPEFLTSQMIFDLFED